MKVNLMYETKDFKFDENEDLSCDLIKDLEFDRILDCMADGDKYVKAVVTKAFLTPLKTPEEIVFRQEILKDCLAHPQEIQTLYGFSDIFKERKRKVWGILSSAYSSATFSSAAEVLRIYMDGLYELRAMSDDKLSKFQSRGFLDFASCIQKELTDEYLKETTKLLKELKDEKEMLISAKFGEDLQGVSYVYRRKSESASHLRWWMAPSYTIPDRDERGGDDISRRKDLAIDEAANALAQAAESLEKFFEQLKCELALYVGAIRLYEALTKSGAQLCFADMLPSSEKTRRWSELSDVSLSLLKNGKVVGNKIEECEKQLFIITGANQGGKTTFLRSMGQAQVMAQSGLFVCAREFKAPVRRKIFTHFKKEEDDTIKSGKLDEELGRLSRIVDEIEPESMILFNESFSSTNEREGSEIFRQITNAFLESEIEIFSVTHLYAYAMEFEEEKKATYLRAERKEDGERTFVLVPGVPKETAFSEDIYKKIFKEN